jgi:ATP/maltotriose-dependent transcriptional regulator MalT
VAVRDRHGAWYLAFAERADPGIRAREQLAWLAALEREHDNLRAALAWYVNREPAAALRLASALWQFWRVHGYNREGRGWLERVLAVAPAPSVARVRALNALAVFATAEGDWPTARTRSEESLALGRAVGDRYFTAWTARDLGFLAQFQGEYAQARAWQEEGLALCRACGDQRGVGAGCYALSWLHAAAGEYPQARALGEESVAALRAVGDRWQLCRALWILGAVEVATGNAARARDLLQEGLAEAETVRSAQMTGWIRAGLGDATLWLGELDGAAAEYDAGLAVAREVGDTVGAAMNLVGLGRVRYCQGRAPGATAHLEEGLALYHGLGSPPGVAQALGVLGRVRACHGDPDGGAALLRESLALRHRLGEPLGVAECLDGLAMAAAHAGRPADARWAARLLGAADALRQQIGAPLAPGEQPRRTAAIRTASVRLGRAAFSAAWQAGRALPPEEAVAEALAGGPTGSHAGGSAATRAPWPAARDASPLTTREQEVAVLIAHGLTNGQIAGALFISPRTADRHVANIFGKLGFTARTQVAAWVGERHWLAAPPGAPAQRGPSAV